MALHAVGNIDDAIDATKAFVLPFELRRWLKLAFVVFFLGGGGGTGGIQNLGSAQNLGDGGGPGGAPVGGGSLTALLETLPALSVTPLQLPPSGPGVPSDAAGALAGLGLVAIVLAVVVVLVLGLAFTFVGAVMEFVFAQSLITTEVHVRRSFRDHLGDGLRLLVFRLVVGLLSLLLLGGLLLAVFVLVVGGNLADAGPSVVLGSVGLFVAALVAVALVFGTINGFTNVFVVPLMIQGDEGVLAGWGRLWSSMTAEPKQYLAYLFLSVVLAIGVSIVGTILGAIAFVALAVPFGIVGTVVWFGLDGGLAAGVIVGLLALAFLFLVLVVANLIKAPLQSFLRYYAMLVLGDIDVDLDPIPEVRASVRTAE